jgi:flagellar protein FliO/FliZ
LVAFALLATPVLAQDAGSTAGVPSDAGAAVAASPTQSPPRVERPVERGLFGEDAAEDPDARSPWLNAFSYFIAFAIVILSIYITLNYGLRRMMGLKAAGSGDSVVRVIERIPLDQRKALFVVKAAGEYLLVGGSDTTLSLISKLNPEEVARIERDRLAAQPAVSPFLQKLLSRRGGPPPPSV